MFLYEVGRIPDLALLDVSDFLIPFYSFNAIIIVQAGDVYVIVDRVDFMLGFCEHVVQLLNQK